MTNRYINIFEDAEGDHFMLSCEAANTDRDAIEEISDYHKNNGLEKMAYLHTIRYTDNAIEEIDFSEEAGI